MLNFDADVKKTIEWREVVFWADVKNATIGFNVKFWRRRQKTTERHQCENCVIRRVTIICDARPDGDVDHLSHIVARS